MIPQTCPCGRTYRTPYPICPVCVAEQDKAALIAAAQRWNVPTLPRTVTAKAQREGGWTKEQG